MTAPTEAEIREAIHDRVREAVGGIPALLSEGNALDPIIDSDMALTRRGWVEDFYPQDNHPGTLWADLTAEQTAELYAAIDAAIDAERLAEIIIDSVVAAAAEFAGRHPDVPRGQYQPARESVTA